ncbi:hypothetical protein EK0264_00595 [Epidermidibacterium keratini]|uniref:Uncharacterized protein n=1 Tax=Epidermidibacterium keratini TaxID=1891644 RepID=A0A7L4YH42_9ACTN|nr:hypothetical protein [Epidermidibacterium keratini]QHB98940.1 hypothetical protein EK0264_00595 [Epidermidibacterium keratini]
MNADAIAELMVDLFSRLADDNSSSHPTQTGLDPDTQDLLAMHYLKEAKLAIARLEREMLATTTLDYTTLGSALGISKQAARQKVRVAKEAQEQIEQQTQAGTPRFAPITLEWAARNLPPARTRSGQALNRSLAGAADPHEDLPERPLTRDFTIETVARGAKRIRTTDEPAGRAS